MKTTIGRFVMEDEGKVLRLRVRESGLGTIAWALSIAAFVAVALMPLSLPAIFATMGAGFALVVSGFVRGSLMSVRRSTYPRVNTLVEFQWPRAGTGNAPDRGPGKGLIVTIDGRTFTEHDVLGVVIAESVETSTLRYANMTTVTRTNHYAPTLVLRSALYELAVYEGADEADAQELGDAVASAISGARTKALRVEWSPTQYAMFGLLVVQVLPQVIALAVSPALKMTHHYLGAVALLAGFLFINIVGTVLVGVYGARERSFAAMTLARNARLAFPHT